MARLAEQRSTGEAWRGALAVPAAFAANRQATGGPARRGKRRLSVHAKQSVNHGFTAHVNDACPPIAEQAGSPVPPARARRGRLDSLRRCRAFLSIDKPLVQGYRPRR